MVRTKKEPWTKQEKVRLTWRRGGDSGRPAHGRGKTDGPP